VIVSIVVELTTRKLGLEWTKENEAGNYHSDRSFDLCLKGVASGIPTILLEKGRKEGMEQEEVTKKTLSLTMEAIMCAFLLLCCIEGI